MKRRVLLAATAGLMIGPGSIARAADTTRAQKAVAAKLEALHAKSAQVVPLTETVVAQASPGRSFFAVRFPLYPVAVAPPDGLNSQNIFVVEGGEKVQTFSEVGRFLDYFLGVTAPAADVDAVKSLTTAWLRLSQEFVQDGYYTFVLPENAFTVVTMNGIHQVTGILRVEKGGSGEISATLAVDRQGKLLGISHKARVTEGPRPKIAGGPRQP